MGTVTTGTTAIGAAQDDLKNHTRILRQVKEAIEVGQGIRGNTLYSFVTVAELLATGQFKFVDDKLIFIPSGGASGINTEDSVTGSGAISAPLMLVGDVASPGVTKLYGTNVLGTRGWYNQPSGGAGSMGPAGPAIFLEGDVGDQGDIGPPGMPGAAGATGATGPTGPTGSTGPTGPAVFLEAESIDPEPPIPGPKGSTGATGGTGSAGPQGPATFLEAETVDPEPAIPGPPGVAGATGSPGSTGATGPAGQTGPATFLEAESVDPEPPIPGPPGIQGPPGSQGPQGSQGITQQIDPSLWMEVSWEDQWPQPIPTDIGPLNMSGNLVVHSQDPQTAAVQVSGSTTLNASRGIFIRAGSSATDYGLTIANYINQTVLVVRGDGGLVMYSSPGGGVSGGDQGIGTINVGNGYYVQGAPIATVAGSINPDPSIMWQETQQEDEWPTNMNTVNNGERIDGGLTLGGGSATNAPATFLPGVVLTTPIQGAFEFDGIVPYFSPANAARAVSACEYICVLESANTLVSQTSAQKIFNSTANGRLTLPVGTYEFECQFELTGMSTVTGGFGFALVGTASFTQAWSSLAVNAAAATATNAQMTYNTAANTAIGTASTAGVATALIKGIFRVTVTGTIIPQVSLATAVAAVVSINSYFKCKPIGNSTVATVGPWS